MRAWAVVETGKPLQEIELPTPEPKGAEVLLEVTHAGVCHSDLHIWEGEYDLGSRGKMRLTDRGVKLPLAMGHEIVGRVAKLGPDAANQGSKVGDIRVVYPWVGCGKCADLPARRGEHVPQRAQPRRLPERRLRDACAGDPREAPDRHRGRRSLAGGDLCLLGRHGLFRHQQAAADGARRADRGGRRRRARAECHRHPEGARPQADLRGRRQRGEAGGGQGAGRDGYRAGGRRGHHRPDHQGLRRRRSPAWSTW